MASDDGHGHRGLQHQAPPPQLDLHTVHSAVDLHNRLNYRPREAAKKSSSTNGQAIKREPLRGRTIKEKKNLFKFF